MDEFEIIRRYFTPDKASGSVIVGVGDDGAVLRPEPQHDLVSVVDTLVEGVHFPSDLPAADIAWRSVAANVSDIAAMGGQPRWMTLALTLHAADAAWLEDFARGIAAAASDLDVQLVGGDITHGTEIVISVQVTGQVGRDEAILRGGANAGDEIFVSGSLGDAAAGLAILQSLSSGEQARDWMTGLVGRFSRPEPRVGLGQAIAGLASAAIDVSDGLFGDLAKLLDASDVSGSIELDDIPLSAALATNMKREDALQFALGGGEDYEICFTVPPGSIEATTQIAGVEVSRIGTVGAGTGLTCTLGGNPYDYQDRGYRHFN